MKSADQMISEQLVGKVLKSLEFGENGRPTDYYIGKEIEQVNISNNDGNAVGIHIFVQGESQPIFVYDNEGIEVY